MGEQVEAQASSIQDNKPDEQARPHGIVQAKGPKGPIERPGWRLFVAWTVATILGFTASFLAGAVISNLVSDSFFHYSPEDSLYRALSVGGTSAIAGLIIGFAQWIVLRKWLPNMLTWIPATGLGWAALGAASVYLEAKLGDSFYSSILLASFWDSLKAAAGGLSVGLCQWVVLRPRIRRAAVWPVASGLSFGLGIGVASALIRTAGVLEPGGTGTATLVPAVVAYSIAFLSVGGISGGALVWLLRMGGDRDGLEPTPSMVWVESDANSPIGGSSSETSETSSADLSLSEQRRPDDASTRRPNSSIRVGIAGVGLIIMIVLAAVYLLSGPLSK